MDPDEARFEGALKDLPDVLAFVEAACRRVDGDDEACFSLKLAAEEAFVNIVTHGGARYGEIRLSFRAESGRGILRIADRGRPFSAEQVSEPDLTAGWQDRPVGGLGLHLIRSMVDELDYRSDPRSGNTLTLVKSLRQELAG